MFELYRLLLFLQLTINPNGLYFKFYRQSRIAREGPCKQLTAEAFKRDVKRKVERKSPLNGNDKGKGMDRGRRIGIFFNIRVI